MSKPHVFAFDTSDQKINSVISFEIMNISNKFKKVNNTDFICEEDCMVDISMSVFCFGLKKSKKYNVSVRATKNMLDIPESITIEDISTSKNIDINFMTELHKDDVIRFHIESDKKDIKIGAPSIFKDGTERGTPISARLKILAF